MIRLEYEEYRSTGPVQGWIIVIVTSILTLTWGMVTHMAVPEVVRHWDFGAVPDTPGMSIYSTVPPAPGPAAAPQIELPPDKTRAR
jgi:hypothetical protein